MTQVSALTPLCNGFHLVPRCAASVSDQASVVVQHIIVDGGSTDGTVEWLRSVAPGGEIRGPGSPGLPSSLIPHPSSLRLRWLSEPDRGMYDALNKGIQLADGEWISWLNADEQYLEGALADVRTTAREHPEADILFGDCLLVRPDGSLIAWRRSATPRWPLITATHLYVPSCALFFHRRIFDAGFRFDPDALAAGDETFMVRVLKAGFLVRRVNRPLAAFTVTGRNLGHSALAQAELHRLKAASPAWARALSPALRLALWASKATCGAYCPPRKLEYAVYVHPDPTVRTRFAVERPDWRWPKEGMKAEG